MGDLICGLKLTHDGAVAVVDGDHLLFSVEAEKLHNQPRYSPLNRVCDLVGVLEANGLRASDLSAVAVDGWLPQPGGPSTVAVIDAGVATSVPVAGYADRPDSTAELLAGRSGTAPIFATGPTQYLSYSHGTGHALASYCTSPFALAARPSLILVWDGAMAPHLYRYGTMPRSFECIATLAPISGVVYPAFASHLAPFRVTRDHRHITGDGMETSLLAVSGKAMAYAALARPAAEAVAVMAEVTRIVAPMDLVTAYRWSREVLGRLAPLALSDAVLMASMQEYLGSVLHTRLSMLLAGRADLRGLPICLSGGCALNIKWNARLRASGLFEDVWVPPFPNDAGSAIGTASAEMVRRTGRPVLSWSVFAGPDITPTPRPLPGWRARPCSIEAVADLLHECGEPVVVVAGRAELGPRALGHRSIVAPAVSATMRDRLNNMKERAPYRPVAPICLQHRAPAIFSPGGHDPYMLFDHQVRSQWLERIPAVVHVDGSARLQTVGPDNGLMYRLLTRYEQRSGIPVLCNTSANFNGSGFFPDAGSAMRWGRTRYVWSEDTLYQGEKNEATW